MLTLPARTGPPAPPAPRSRTLAAAAACCLLAATACAPDGDAGGAPGEENSVTAEAATDGPPPPCSGLQRVAILPSRIDEASGVAVSRRHRDVLWIHNDSEGEPQLYALDTRGRLIRSFEVPVADQTDWEDIEIGPCPAGECLYIGDIGDNLHERDDRAVLRLPEPDPRAGGDAPPVERFPIRYPDGARDAEALFVRPDGSVWILSKGRSGPVTLYRYPPPLRAGERVTLERVQQLTDGLQQLPGQVTGATATPDGRHVLVRTYAWLQLYRFEADTLAPVWSGAGLDLRPLQEPQGEGVGLGPDGSIYLVSEVGPLEQAAPLSRVECRL
jgi:hypothetical protein